MVPAKFATSVSINPMLEQITTDTHVSGHFFPGSSGRCCETARKKITNAASSRRAETGRNKRQCQPYTFAVQRIATPIVHRIQHAHAAPKAGFVAPRSFGIE